MRSLVRRGLLEEGHTVDSEGAVNPALELAETTPYDVMVIDVTLPGQSGLDLVRFLRAAGNRTPVLMLTARDSAADVVAGLDAGADDYLTKPFAFKVLLARLRALGRRTPLTREVVLQVADLQVESASRVVKRNGVVVALTRTEYNLLECLIRQAGRVVTREKLMAALWSHDRDVERNTLDAFVKSLRQKIDAEEPRLIHTIRGVGYCLRGEPEA